jgi:hypothetical protein
VSIVLSNDYDKQRECIVGYVASLLRGFILPALSSATADMQKGDADLSPPS